MATTESTRFGVALFNQPVRYSERLEYAFNVLLAQSDAGVGHGDSQNNPRLCLHFT